MALNLLPPDWEPLPSTPIGQLRARRVVDERRMYAYGLTHTELLSSIRWVDRNPTTREFVESAKAAEKDVVEESRARKKRKKRARKAA